MARKQKEMDPQTLEILSSIRQIIDDEEGEDKPAAKRAAKQKPAPKAKPVKKAKPASKKPVTQKTMPKKSATKEPEDILVLTELAPEDTSKKATNEDAKVIQMPTPVEEVAEVEPVVASDIIEDLDLDNALEELVRDMLKEKLQDYLDQHLSDMIKKVAAEELAKMRKKD